MDYKELEKQAGISEYGHCDQGDPPGLGLNTDSEEQKFLKIEDEKSKLTMKLDPKPLNISVDNFETVLSCQKYIDEMTDEEQDEVEKEADEAGMSYITICLSHGFIPRPTADNVSDADGLEVEKRERTKKFIEKIKRDFEYNASKNKGKF